ncbi:hypothetical protein GU926_00530 [Nibribacter ruber]|uniref:DUF4595 domain-containing protein n=1 Tax=Nibribacter ruber TaxID=2698458 RepID=A0A6P1NSL6_9BACT|nr:hypothetical protein [Nibribacter ruber]QHL86010.1 hypothetical protein GU926_00530 [Nibribacter ruber]
MKKLFKLLCLSAFVLVTGCSDDKDEATTQTIKLSKLTVTDTDSQHGTFTYNFTYNDKGALYQFTEKSTNGYYDNTTTHIYNNNGLLTSNALEGKGYGAHYKDSFTYDANTRLTSIEHKYVLISDPTRPTEPLFYTFEYNAQGQISRINTSETSGTNGSAAAYLLTYDKAGNVSRQERYTITNTGELKEMTSDIAFTYDNKKNPYYKLGAINFLYGYTIIGFVSFSEPISPNNMTKAVIHLYGGGNQSSKTIDLQYEYNDRNLPTKVTYGNVTHILEYTIK